ncbi:MAG: iron-containing alcohol dehydrogenase [Proteobacteria bacterium]|nr:iron-containing alcohol dehydrogenase [Pseudomonadota bacterium]MBU1060177.1 iron-containing alcohol dehydrogenase [Pseudomonadota bacterium]
MSFSLNHLRKFVAPEIIFGNGSRKLAGQYCKNFHTKKAIIVTDEGIIKAGWTREVENSLSAAGIEFVTYSGVTPNPRATEVMTGAQLYLAEGCDAIIAVGGGSPLDCAKGIGIVISNGGHILEYEGVDRIQEPLPPMVFIPTTAGTSADLSQFCMIVNREQLIKIAIISKIVIPDVALIDPETTTTMDPYLTSCTGIDALVHAIEAYVSIASSGMTDIHALAAIKLLSVNLPKIKARPMDLVVRENIMLASMEAGLAFSNAVLGAVHAMSHSLGGLLDLPHGECNSLLLEHVINYNFDSAPERFRVIADTMGIDSRGMLPNELKGTLFRHVKDLRNQLGISKSLGLVNVTKADIPHLAMKAINDACIVTNPREANRRDLEVIYEEAL